VKMTVYRVAKDVGSFSLDDVSLQMDMPRGFVTFSFDDGIRQGKVAGLLKKYSIHATFYIYSDPVLLNWKEYFTPAQVKALSQAGHEIGSHTRTHPHMTELSDADLLEEVRGSKQALEDMTGQSVKTFAYPYGEYDQRVINVVRQYHIAARATRKGLNSRTQDRYALRAFCPLNTTTVAEVKALIDEAGRTNQWLILCFHKIRDQGDESSYTPKKLKAVLAYAKRATVITVQQGVQGYLRQ
jgi:large repetitive protein